MIEVRDLSKTFPGANGPIAAVDGIHFTVHPGEVFGLLGPNGAGKTTTLRMLCTVLKPTGGTATVAGYDVVEQPSEVRRHVGFLSANTGVYDRASKPFDLDDASWANYRKWMASHSNQAPS